MKTAGVLAIVLAFILGGMAIYGEVDSANHAADRINEGFAAIRANDQATLDRMSHESDDEKAAEQHELMGAAVCLIAGIALIAAGRKAKVFPVDEVLSSTLGLDGTQAHLADEMDCPYCAEKIKRAAIVCRYCRRDLPGARPAV